MANTGKDRWDWLSKRSAAEEANQRHRQAEEAKWRQMPMGPRERIDAQRAKQLQDTMDRMLAQSYARVSIAPTLEPRHRPSPDYPNTMGWRAWRWNMAAGVLTSPVQGTPWTGHELRCTDWDETEVVRGAAGIHAHLVPEHWDRLRSNSVSNNGLAWIGPSSEPLISIQGIVERFGKYALGTEGWRAEWVMIRKLAAPTQAIGLALEKAFPEVEIVYGDR